jgi:aspartyl-tRNA synthetase
MNNNEYQRSHTCGDLRENHIDQKISLCGWVHRRRDHGGLIFIDLRDRFGITQLVFDPNISKSLHNEAQKLRSEWVLNIKGIVKPRGEGLINTKLATGEIEIEVSGMNILNEANTPPFSICESNLDVKEETRLKYRYLDIRRGDITKNLLIRHKALLCVRNFLNAENFLEIQTPILAKSTPEGARDYLVPSRIYPGNFFALPQSPQIFKQLLMVAGMDKYFQIAPCFRDEDLRSDRQPEFSQIDIEISFGKIDDILALAEKMLKKVFKECINIELSVPFPRITYKDSVELYGTDKPDLRFNMPLIRLDDIILASNFDLLKKYVQENKIVKALCVKNGASFSRKEIDELGSFVSKFNINGLAWMKKTSSGFSSNIVKFFNPGLLEKIQERLKVEENDLVLIAAEDESIVNQGLDHLRRHLAKKLNLIDPSIYEFTWVVDFPMFSKDSQTKELKSEHHPFTLFNIDDTKLMDSDPLKVRSLAYDLVVNGYELAGGSQRIHCPKIQEKIFKILKLSKEDIDEKFGFFINALKYGTPPHLGIAFGLDRLIMVLLGTDNIRDVIAFPKTQKASDLMMQCPSPPLSGHLDELKIKSEITEIFWE